MRTRAVVLALAATSAQAQPCPIDEAVPPGTLLTIRSTMAAQHVSAANFAALAQTERVQRRTVAAAEAASQPALEQSIRYGGVLLRDVLASTLAGDANRRTVRAATIEALATDGYRAAFSWGELFNSAAGDQVLVIRSQDGTPLGAEQGPLALRALADLRPGPRHVRNFCALIVRMPDAR